MRCLSYIVLAALLLQATLIAPAKADATNEDVKPKAGPKIRRTIRVRESAPPIATAAEPSAGVNVSNSGPSNSVEVAPNISITGQPAETPRASAENDDDSRPSKRVRAEPELETVEPSAGVPTESVPANKQVQSSNSFNGEQSLVENSNNNRNVVQRNSGNVESVIIDGVGNTKTTKISMGGKPDGEEHEHKDSHGCKHADHRPQSEVHHHHHYHHQHNSEPESQVAKRQPEEQPAGVSIKSEGQTGSPLFQININGERQASTEQPKVERPMVAELWPQHLLPSPSSRPVSLAGLGPLELDKAYAARDPLYFGMRSPDGRFPSAYSTTGQVQPIVYVVPMMSPMMQPMMQPFMPMMMPMGGYPFGYPFDRRPRRRPRRRDSWRHDRELDEGRRRRRPSGEEKPKRERRRKPKKSEEPQEPQEPQVKPEPKTEEKHEEEVEKMPLLQAAPFEGAPDPFKLAQLPVEEAKKASRPLLQLPEGFRRGLKTAAGLVPKMPRLPAPGVQPKEEEPEIEWIPVPKNRKSKAAQ